MKNHIIISTQDHLGDYKIEKTFGLVQGNTVRSRNIFRNLIANLRTVIGGEIPELTEVIAQAREEAVERMIRHAVELGANAIVGVRFITSELGQNCSEIMAYGTAVKLQNVAADFELYT